MRGLALLALLLACGGQTRSAVDGEWIIAAGRFIDFGHGVSIALPLCDTGTLMLARDLRGSVSCGNQGAWLASATFDEPVLGLHLGGLVEAQGFSDGSTFAVAGQDGASVIFVVGERRETRWGKSGPPPVLCPNDWCAPVRPEW